MTPAIFTPELPLYQYDAVEVHPVMDVNYRGQTHAERCEPSEAHYWSCYLHLVTGGIECVADFRTEAQASDHAKTLTALVFDPDVAAARARARRPSRDISEDFGEVVHLKERGNASASSPRQVFYSDSAVDAAMCAWEELVIRRGKDDSYAALNTLFDNVGFAVLRQETYRAGPYIHETWMALTEDERDEAGSFDFEFVPLMLDHTDFGDSGYTLPSLDLVRAAIRTRSESRSKPALQA